MLIRTETHLFLKYIRLLLGIPTLQYNIIIMIDA